ncbi:MAG: VWFA-related Acidobacterial domain protein [Acidobacteria bacterium]|nr:VWFA-related Acidobacterial domain protein [Acidobacteriota bacterium]
MDGRQTGTRPGPPGRLGRRAAALAAWGVAAAWLAGAPAAQVFRGGVDLASFGVTVVDRKGGLVTDLTPDEFEVREDGQLQAVTLFARGDAVEAVPPLRLGLLFDTSGSMEESIGFSRSAAIKFLNTVQEARDITLVDFDTEVRVVRYGQHDFARVVERIRKRKPDGNTALYDALGVYLDGASAEEGRRTLVLYTDGGDTSSSMSYGEAQTLLRASDITLYAIGFLSHLSQALQFDQRHKLRTLAELTGGLAYFPSVLKDLDPTYERIAAEIRGQFTLGYLSTNTKLDGAWRKVEIKVKRPGVKVRSRQGYFAPYRQRP